MSVKNRIMRNDGGSGLVHFRFINLPCKFEPVVIKWTMFKIFEPRFMSGSCSLFNIKLFHKLCTMEGALKTLFPPAKDVHTGCVHALKSKIASSILSSLIFWDQIKYSYLKDYMQSCSQVHPCMHAPLEIQSEYLAFRKDIRTIHFILFILCALLFTHFEGTKD